MAPFGSRTSPIRPRIHKNGKIGIKKDKKRVKNASQGPDIKKRLFLVFLEIGQKMTFLGGMEKPHGLDTPEPYLNPLKHSFGSVWLL